ncbi:MAG: phosphomannomutase [Vicinamibacteria bacterium]|nr:phosphomannomutase [Vicinamibacteria bacterium]
MSGLNGATPGSLAAHLDYDPRELRFGTSGRRGNVVDLTQLEIYVNALAELEFLLELPDREGGIRPGDVFYYAYDLRPSSTRLVAEEMGRGEIAQAVAQAVADAGLKPVNLGRLPSPAIAHYAISRGKGSIMVTGSHIPFERNGYKVNTSVGELLKRHERPIDRLVAQTRRRIYEQPFERSLFNARGMFKSGSRALPPEIDVARLAYVERYADFFAGAPLGGKKILVYQHSAVGRDILVEILERVGANVVPAGRSETFVPIDTENVDHVVLAGIQSLVDEEAPRHGAFDAVVSTDGDSDRPLILGMEEAQDGSGRQRVRFFGGDLVGMVVADFLDADAVVVSISCNDGVDRGDLKDRLEPKTRIGSPHIIAGMERALGKDKSRVVGWEANGGFLTGSDIERQGRVLRALPTRDAVLPILATLTAASERGWPITRLFERLPRRFSKAALLKRFPRATSLEILRRFSMSDPNVMEARFEQNATECLDFNEALMPHQPERTRESDQIRRRLEAIFNQNAGFDRIIRVNWTDGVRVSFSNGDVAHVRPSGNADDLRIYAVADSQQRADAVAALGVAEPDGILRRLEKAALS